jgi:hypothetical protein
VTLLTIKRRILRLGGLHVMSIRVREDTVELDTASLTTTRAKPPGCGLTSTAARAEGEREGSA